MELYVGGRAQGKLAYVKKIHEEENVTVVDGTEMVSFLKNQKEMIPGRIIWNHFHQYVWDSLQQKPKEREEFLMQVLEYFPDVIVISDEVGSGIVPIKPEEREYRDETGRLLCMLAQRAERMERVICQIGQRIK